MNGPICSTVRTSIRENIAILQIHNPPVNALTTGVPQGIVEALDTLRDDASVHAVVIHGAGRNFAAGADIKEFVRFIAGQGPMPELNSSFNAIEDFPKPVIMAIHGAALGAGLELAMAGHYRIATADAQLGQPEVKIGLIPGAGGTQRLPRLVGVRKAAEMCAFGEPITATDALTAGLIDRLAPEWGVGPQSRAEAPASANHLLEAAVQFAREAPPVRRTKDLQSQRTTSTEAAAILNELRALCHKQKRGLEAPLAALDAIQASLTTDLDAGLAKEAEIFRRVMLSDQAKALIHAFFAERAVARVPNLAPDTPVMTIQQAAIVGAGTMGGGISMALANAGIPVRLRDADQASVERGMQKIRANYDRSIQSGRLTEAQRDARMALIIPHAGPQSDWTAFDQADLIIEAVFESMEAKREVFADLDRIAKPGAILASNTSTLDLNQIAAATTRPERVVGLHFFSPANVMRLLEIVQGRATAPEVLATAMAFAKQIKKVGVVVGNGFGFVGNRMVIPYMDEAQFLVEEGATPEQVDRVLTNFGMAMGPFAVADLSGLDVFWRIHEERFPKSAKSPAREPIGLELLYRERRYGQKTQAGWFKYGSDRKPQPDPNVVELVQAAATQRGIPQREISDAEILDRCLLSLINEGAKVLEEGIALRALDIDVIYMTGYGFPSHRGGPMFYADTVGLEKILKRVRELQKEQGARWKPAGLLEKLAEEGKGFGEPLV